jgi:hypothetical protein
MCGTNAPHIAQLAFWELNLPSVIGSPGLPNTSGIEVLGFAQGTVRYLPKVAGGRLTASRPSPADPAQTLTLSGGQLTGGELLLAAGGQTYSLRVTAIGQVASAVTPKLVLETYQLDGATSLAGHDGEFHPVCGHPPTGAPGDGDLLGMTGALASQAVLLEGERIDPATQREAAADPAWVNFGCAGSPLAALALTGHADGIAAAPGAQAGE